MKLYAVKNKNGTLRRKVYSNLGDAKNAVHCHGLEEVIVFECVPVLSIKLTKPDRYTNVWEEIEYAA